MSHYESRKFYLLKNVSKINICLNFLREYIVVICICRCDCRQKNFRYLKVLLVLLLYKINMRTLNIIIIINTKCIVHSKIIFNIIYECTKIFTHSDTDSLVTCFVFDIHHIIYPINILNNVHFSRNLIMNLINIRENELYGIFFYLVHARLAIPRSLIYSRV